MVRTLPRPHRFQPDTCGTRCISCSSAWLGSSAEIAHRTASSSTVHSRTRAPRQSTNIVHEHHASLSRLQIIPLSRLSRRLASSRAHLERRLLRRRLRRRLDRLHRAARSSVSHPRSRTRTRARASSPIPSRASPSLERASSDSPPPLALQRPTPITAPVFPTPLARVSLDSTPPSRRSRAHLHHRLHRVRSHRLFARHRPSSAARRGRGRGRGSSTRSVGRSRVFRVSFACLSRVFRVVWYTHHRLCTHHVLSLSRVHTDPLAPASPGDGAAGVSGASESPVLESYTVIESYTVVVMCCARARGGCA